ncbi:Arc family DNA-binding protein [Massilia sp. CCM 8734]|uniref:Arc family DNA-binding protein n=1 Tax=Massilia sp. CCM 8734 TaxID=2609283 RepID=UPI001421B361|nr:Arc family DNA-binding protein [Massilia sp. CCM 8734]NHZ98073.1 Arc family DNA-binding protein [Massilia sp. CCM 8734]
MAKKPYPSEVLDRYIVRLPNGMRDQIARAAEKNGRSMNSEIVARLAYTFEKDLTDWVSGSSTEQPEAGKYTEIADLIVQHLERRLVFQMKPVKLSDPHSPPSAEVETPVKPARKRVHKPKP